MTDIAQLQPLTVVHEEPPYERFCALRKQMMRVYRQWLADRPTVTQAEIEAQATGMVMHQLCVLDLETDA